MPFLAIFRSSLISVILVSIILSNSAYAKPEQGKKFKDWTVVCEKLPKSKKKVCNIFQNVTNEKDVTVMQVAIGYPPGSKTAQTLITLPLGVMLQPGIEFKAGSAKAIRVPFQVCVKSGCVAIVKMSNELIKGMKAGSKGGIKFAAAQKQVIEIPVSLSGFTAAFNSLKK